MNVIIQYCSMACLIALSFCDSNTTLDDDEFPSVEAFTVMNEVTEDILDASTVAGDLSISEEQLFEMPPPLLDFETTSPPPQRSSSHQLDTFDDSQISSNFSTKPLVITPAASFPSPINSFNTMMNKAKQFADQYLTKKQQHQLHVAVTEARNSGSDTDEVRRVVLRFLNSVLTAQQKKEISARKEELHREFSDDAVLRSQ